MNAPVPEIWFYHLTKSRAEDAIANILTKAHAQGKRITIRCQTEAWLDHLNDYLWTFNPASFLPHGSMKEPNAADHPIYLTTGPENPNQSEMLFLTEGHPIPADGYTRILYFFDAQNQEATLQARAEWRHQKASNANLSYWQQDENGSWKKN